MLGTYLIVPSPGGSFLGCLTGRWAGPSRSSAPYPALLTSLQPPLALGAGMRQSRDLTSGAGVPSLRRALPCLPAGSLRSVIARRGQGEGGSLRRRRREAVSECRTPPSPAGLACRPALFSPCRAARRRRRGRRQAERGRPAPGPARAPSRRFRPLSRSRNARRRRRLELERPAAAGAGRGPWGWVEARRWQRRPGPPRPLGCSGREAAEESARRRGR
jgi:hypothetical protein